MRKEKCFITFPSSYHVLQAEKILRARGLDFSVVPIPREITSSCGMAIMYNCSEHAKYFNVIESSRLPVEDFHRLKFTGTSSLWDKLLR
ncbi:DUF3343 domain-containing protein [Thermincola potens]|uniref:Putative Se/S carrier protein-like domain-containing protein n=1 Tax=Thermincola potens (strain JR) TaxID=635013 RepID=D5XAN1_THEPJ|nr:conserved hypothetical protein [Thermincola potens JR]